MMPIVDPPCIGCIAAETEDTDPVMRQVLSIDPPRAVRTAAQRAALSVLSILHAGDGTVEGMMSGLCETCSRSMAYAKRVRAAREGGG